MKTFYSLIILLFFVFCSDGLHAENQYKQLSAEKCDSLIKSNSANPNFVILDVRTLEEWIDEHLEGSIYRSLYDSDFQQELERLPKHKIYLLHCRSGSRSASAFRKMQNLEFNEVYEMIGGIVSWKNKKLPTTQTVEPRLMLVSHEGFNGKFTDTVKVTITNRANDQLKFTTVTINDDHPISHDFDHEIILEGAEDYTFSIYHDSGYNDEDSTHVLLESNGGEIQFKVNVEKEIATAIESLAKNEISIYPNPAQHKLFIKGINSNDGANITIYNLLGTKVLQEYYNLNNNEISLTHLKEGIHIVRVKNGDTFFSKKLLIKR